MQPDIDIEEASAPIDEDPAQKLERFKLELSRDADATQEQRESATEDTRFVNVEGGMWENFVEDYAENRVRMEMDIVSNPLQRFVGEWDLNRVGVEYKPDGPTTTDDDAELLNGIYRADFRNFDGALATSNAVSEVGTCGAGALKLATAFDDEGDPENENQHIEWRPMNNVYSTVFWDEAAQRMDKTDANHCTELRIYSPESFERFFPGKKPVSAYTPDDFYYEHDTFYQREKIYIAIRYEIVKEKETFFIYNNLQTEQVLAFPEDEHELIKDELAADKNIIKVREREKTVQRVYKTVFSGDEILKPAQRIAGEFIPIIPFYGFWSYDDGVERYRGIVRKMKDAQRLYNMQASQLTENAASDGQEIPIFLREQVQNTEIQNAWADKNNKSYLVVDPVKNNAGDIVSAGPIGYNKAGTLDQNAAQLIEIVLGYVKDQGGYVPTDAINKEMSGKAMRLMTKRENLNTQIMNSNIKYAIEHSGKVYQSMAKEIYTTQRMVRTLGKDGTFGSAQLQESVMDEESGKMVMSNDLNGKRFMAYADIGPQYDSVREETVEDLKGTLELVNQVKGGERYMPALMAALFDNISGVGLDGLKELNRRIMLEMGMAEPETPEEEKMLADLRQQAQQPNPQQQLVAAAAQQQMAEAREKDASARQKTADANLKDAKTVETLEGIETDKTKLFLEAQNQTFEQASSGLN